MRSGRTPSNHGWKALRSAGRSSLRYDRVEHRYVTHAPEGGKDRSTIGLSINRSVWAFELPYRAVTVDDDHLDGSQLGRLYQIAGVAAMQYVKTAVREND